MTNEEFNRSTFLGKPTKDMTLEEALAALRYVLERLEQEEKRRADLHHSKPAGTPTDAT